MSQSDLYTALPLGKHLSLVTKMYVGVLTKRLERLELKKNYSILILVEKNEDKCTQQFLCDFLKIDKASMVRLIDDFVKKKFLKRTTDPKDRRAHRLQLTPKAKKIMPEIHKAVKEVNSKALKGLSAKQARDFYTSISVINANLSKEPANRIIVNFKKAK